MRIIMALDILDGKCVRLVRGNYNTSKIYSASPLDIAREIEDNGIRYLHLVDLDGAKERKIKNINILEKISAQTKLTIDFGGGLRSEQDVKAAFSSGASQVTGGTVALTNPSVFMEWLQIYGKEKIILGADFMNRKVVSEAWTAGSQEDIVSYITGYSLSGVSFSICTDAGRDGMMRGPATEIYREILGSARINLIASGGIASIKDIRDIADAGCEGAIIGKAVYEGRITLKELGSLC